MSAIAVVIGIDAYEQAELTSAVNDALTIRDTLLELELVEEIVLLTAPAVPGALEATRRNINEALKEIHDKGSRAERLYFYYAGHGLSAYTDAAHAVSQTALVPPDVFDLAADANLLINFDDFRQRLEAAGPAEQFFFVDACRDLAFGERPGNLPSLGWPGSPAPSPRPTAQATLFAVSPGGQALGIREQLGVMTGALVDALHGRGTALDFSDELDEYVVTAESIARHVRARVEHTVEPHEGWRHQIMLPELRVTAGVMPPLRIVESPPETALTITFEPEAAAADAKVDLTLRGRPLLDPRWPPRRHGEAVPLAPLVYRIKARAEHGTATAEPAKVDLRECDRAIIRIDGDGDGPIAPPLVGPTPGEAHVTTAKRWSNVAPSPTTAAVHADAQEPGAMVELVGQEPPYLRWEGAGELRQDGIPPGSYIVRFRLGREVYSEADIDLVGGEAKTVFPGGVRSPLLAEAGSPDVDGSVVLAPEIGRVRSSALATVLPLLGVLPFDTTGEVSWRWQPALERLDLGAFEDRAVRVVVAVDGTTWSRPPDEIAAGVTCELIAVDGTRQRVDLIPVEESERGWGRVVHGTAPAPGPWFIAAIRSAALGTIELASAALPDRITVIGLTPSPDGRLDPVQHVLRVPGRTYDELEPHIPYSRFLRELVLGQRLYDSGELIERGGSPDSSELMQLVLAKWTDPILGCMAYYAWNDALARGLWRDEAMAAATAEITARNLVGYFGDLPDARVIAALAGVTADPRPSRALAPGEIPLLAQTLRACAADEESSYAITRRWASRVAPDSTWSLVWQPDASAPFLTDESVATA